MRSKLLIGTLALGLAGLGAGCVAHAQTTGYAEADAPVVFADEPTLVAVEPDVWVVRDYDYAVYYVDGYYWVYRGDAWHRSRAYGRGWTTVEVTVVPRVIVTRDHHAYVHYHGVANAQTRKAPNDQAATGPDEDKRRDRPEHADDHHDGPPGQDKDKGPRPPEHADDHHDGPGHDDRAGANQRHEEADRDAKKDNVRREDNKKEEEKREDDKKKGDKKDKKKADKK
jgi:hypothetical protein